MHGCFGNTQCTAYVAQSCPIQLFHGESTTFFSSFISRWNYLLQSTWSLLDPVPSVWWLPDILSSLWSLPDLLPSAWSTALWLPSPCCCMSWAWPDRYSPVLCRSARYCLTRLTRPAQIFAILPMQDKRADQRRLNSQQPNWRHNGGLTSACLQCLLSCTVYSTWTISHVHDQQLMLQPLRLSKGQFPCGSLHLLPPCLPRMASITQKAVLFSIE